MTTDHRDRCAESEIGLFPTAAGEPRALPPGALHQYYDAWWFPEGRRILIAGNEADRPRRLFVQQDLGRGPEGPHPRGCMDSRERHLSGREMGCRWNGSGTDVPLPVDGGDPRPIPGLSREEYVLRWSADGRHVFVAERGLRKMPAPIFRLDVESGRRETWKELMPADPAGVTGLAWICLTPDGQSYAYTYARRLSDLYLVENLR